VASIGIIGGGTRIARPRGVLALGWACIESAVSGRLEHRPTSADYPETLIRRASFDSGGDLGWKISALVTPRQRPARWKIVVITGAPSWAEYWAPVMAALPGDREMIVVDRPGYGYSEPDAPVPDIQVQARALAPVLRAAPGQSLVLVGQSYGAAIAALMAAASPRRVASLVLLSSYLGESGPTARWLLDAGSRLKGLIPRDLRAAVIEVCGQPAQLPLMRQALAGFSAPVHVIHGEADDFAPIELAQRLAAESPSRGPIRFESVPQANHFLNDGPVETMIACLEACLPEPRTSLAKKAELWIADVAARLPRRASAELGGPSLAG
jgi:pimeloyl-ACP methyl ester carboxylesterase